MNDRDECSICLETYTNKSRVDNCVHFFCFDCIKAWTRNTNTCPLCKARITKIEKVDAPSLSKVAQTSTSRVTRSKVDKDAEVAVQPCDLSSDLTYADLNSFGVTEEEIAASGFFDDDAVEENIYDTNDGWCVSDDEPIRRRSNHQRAFDEESSASTSSSSGSSDDTSSDDSESSSSSTPVRRTNRRSVDNGDGVQVTIRTVASNGSTVATRSSARRPTEPIEIDDDDNNVTILNNEPESKRLRVK